MSMVSVIIPAYNCARYLERAVRSALVQAEVGEILLVEDDSRDDTLAACERCLVLDPRVRLHRHADGGNHGAAATRNLGLEKATQPLIAFLDADDYYLPGRFQRAVELLRDPAISGVYEAVVAEFESEAARAQFMERRGWALTDRERGLTTILPGIAPENLFTALVVGGASFCHMNALTIRASLACAVGGFLAPLRLHQDLHYLYKLAYRGRLVAGRVTDPVAVRWVHANNRITLATTQTSAPYRRLLFRDLCLWALEQGMPRPAFILVLKRYLQLYARAVPGLSVNHPLNQGLRRLSYAVHFMGSPVFALRILIRLLRP